MSQVVREYPHLAPGLCGRLACRRLCLRSEHCPAGQRRRSSLLSQRAIRRFSVALDRRRGRICAQIHDSGQCSSLCQGVGGCFLPQVGDHPSEARRKSHRAQRALDEFVRRRLKGGKS